MFVFFCLEPLLPNGYSLISIDPFGCSLSLPDLWDRLTPMRAFLFFLKPSAPPVNVCRGPLRNCNAGNALLSYFLALAQC